MFSNNFKSSYALLLTTTVAQVVFLISPVLLNPVKISSTITSPLGLTSNAGDIKFKDSCLDVDDCSEPLVAIVTEAENNDGLIASLQQGVRISNMLEPDLFNITTSEDGNKLLVTITTRSSRTVDFNPATPENKIMTVESSSVAAIPYTTLLGGVLSTFKNATFLYNSLHEDVLDELVKIRSNSKYY